MKKIEIHHIDRECRAVTTHTFPVRWGGEAFSDILESCIVEGDEAEALFQLMRRALNGSLDYTLCGHYPDYGLRVIENGATIFETTVCLTCANWIRVLHGQGERFSGEPVAFSELSAALQGFVPLSRESQDGLIHKKMLQAKMPPPESQ
jgi:hypothetical protein